MKDGSNDRGLEKGKDVLCGASDTLYIPLTARVWASKRFPDLLYDEAALSLEAYVPESVLRASPEYAMMASAARDFNLDGIARAFIARHGGCNVIDLGAGLNALCSRLKDATDGKDVRSWSVDLPDVIELRRSLLGEGPKETLIAGDILALDWARGIDRSLPSLLIASGVFQYFHEEEVVGLVRDLSELFPLGELAFDATTKLGIRYANRYVRKTGNTSAPMHFSIDDQAAFLRKTGATLLERRPFFVETRRRLGRRLKPFTRLAMWAGDTFAMALVYHLRLAPRPAAAAHGEGSRGLVERMLGRDEIFAPLPLTPLEGERGRSYEDLIAIGYRDEGEGYRCSGG